jgi:hypothetical protein
LEVASYFIFFAIIVVQTMNRQVQLLNVIDRLKKQLSESRD